MKKKTILGCVLMLILMLVVPVSAAVKIDLKQSENVFNVTAEGIIDNKLSVIVTKRGETVPRWIGDAYSDSNGKISFSFELEDKYDGEPADGSYTLSMTGANKYRKYSQDFEYKSASTRNEIFAGIRTADDVIALFGNADKKEELVQVGIFVDEFNALSTDNKRIIANKIAALKEKTAQNIIDTANPNIIYLKLMADGKDKLNDNLNTYAEKCYGANINSDLYKAVIADKKIGGLYSYLEKLDSSASEKLASNFDDVLITSLFRSATDIDDMQNIILNYGQYAGVDLTKYNNMDNKRAFVMYMTTGEYNSKADIQKRYNEYKPISNDTSGGGGSGGSSGGGGGNSGGSIGGLGSSSSGNGEPRPVAKKSNGIGVKLDGNLLTQYDSVQSLVDKFKFDDMGNYQWANEAVVILAAKGIVAGIGDNKFAPEREITREEFAKLVSLAFEIQDEAAIPSFSDVLPGRWSANAIASLAKAEIIGGIGDNLFDPQAQITRQDMAVIIDRAMTYKAVIIESQKKDDFSDVDEIADYAKDSVKALYSTGIVSGMGDGTFMPRNKVTRAEAAQIIYNCVTSFGGEEG